MSRRLMLRNASGGGGLPSEYQRVEWISTTDPYNQWIDTGIYLTSEDVVEIVINTAISSIPNENQFLFGATVPKRFTINLYNAVEVTLRFGDLAPDAYITISGDAEISLQNGLLVVNGIEHNFTQQQAFVQSVTCPIIGYRSSNAAPSRPTGPTVKYKHFSILEKFYGIPCYRKSDGKIGMFDAISNTFFTNAGTGTFTKGADVN